jgi:hypothetical protein
MGETLEGVSAQAEALQFGQDVSREHAPSVLQRLDQLREPFANQAMEEVVVCAAVLGAHGRPGVLAGLALHLVLRTSC